MGRLDRLELENFKSYEGHRVIGPFRDFTCIIGPNGSGKSNVMDAISFVLGVPSRYLRSQNLHELVHRSENKKRKPIQKATVKAVYVKDDGQEVSLSRTVIASSGASEYRIDNSQVSFGEYNRFLEQENILTKAHNFLIFQGDVEALSQKTPMELTRLIEQICGSDGLKEEYDAKRKEFEQAEAQHVTMLAQKKELVEESKLIVQQKTDSAKFDRLDERKRELEIEKQTWKIWYLEEQIKEKEKLIATKKAELKEHNSGPAEEATKQLKKQQTSTQKELYQAEKKLQQAQANFSELLPAAVQVEEQIKHSKNKILAITENIKKLNQEIARNEKDLQIVQRNANEIQIISDNFEKESQLKLQMSQLSEGLMQEYTNLQLLVQDKTAKESMKLETLERKHAPDIMNKKQIESKQQELQILEKNLLEQIQTHQGPHRNLSQIIENATNELRKVESDLSEIQAQKILLQNGKSETSARLKAALENLNQVKADKNESERDLKQRGAIETLKRLFPGVHGRMVDLVRPIHKKHEMALALTLGKNLDAIVVDQERTALNCIKHLRDQRMSPMTFIPLDTIQAKTITDPILRTLQGVRLAVDIVQYDSVYTKAIQYACGTTIICEDIKTAKEICYSHNNLKVKAITIDGTIIHKNGMMTGGSSQLGTVRRWEEKEVSIMKANRDQCLSILTELNKKLKRIEEEERERAAKKSELESRIEYIGKEESVLAGKLSDLNQHLDATRKEKVELEEQMKSLSRSLEKYEKESRSTRQIIAKVQDELYADFCKRTGYSNIREFEASRMSIEQEINDTKMQYSSTLIKLKNQITFLEQERAEIVNKANHLERQKDNEQKSLQQAEKKTEDLKGKFKSGQDAIEKSKATVQDITNSLSDIVKKLKKSREALRKEHSVLDGIQRQVSMAECDIENYSALRLDILRKCKLAEIPLPLSNRTNLDPSTEIETTKLAFNILSKQMKQEKNEALAEAHYNEQLRELQVELDRLSAILIPVERLYAMEQRHMEAQKHLNQAQKQWKELKDQFNTIKNQRLALFQPALQHIFGTIDQMYKELTRNDRFPTGGMASLALDITIDTTTNKKEDEPYNCGIIYHAMPPGKHHLDMDQLSGGERTVASLALLFAIHSYRPAPFFILDEIDAALDNPNVQRVVRFLKARSTLTTTSNNNHNNNNNDAAAITTTTDKNLIPKGTQIIVISLKTSLYEKASALVGIYRDPEECSSAILTLSLEDYPES